MAYFQSLASKPNYSFLYNGVRLSVIDGIITTQSADVITALRQSPNFKEIPSIPTAVDTTVSEATAAILAGKTPASRLAALKKGE